ncbi:protein kinase family protein [Alkalicoccobacillus gibsonii]|uniref:Protein kinase family protein n=1 Tax=Alkalicoccobacillus gibsonii TaxID=79881 RepID=A0ABU9VFX8_9BACI
MNEKAPLSPSSVSRLASSVTFTKRGKQTALSSFDQSLTLVGSGRSAYVFKLPNVNRVLKVFYPPYEQIASEEAEIYRSLAGTTHYPMLYEAGQGYLVIDYICGQTFFQCLLQGVRVRPEHIKAVDVAIDEARLRGLNPSDIHLHNLILTEDGSVRVIDVARFKQSKQCKQWDDLKRALNVYHSSRLFPKRLPKAMLYAIAACYKTVQKVM